MLRTVAGTLIRAGRLGILPAAYNPPTMAHLALAEAAERAFGLDQVAYVLPATLPHKAITRPDLQERLEWLSDLAADGSDRLAATCTGGLVIDIVREIQAGSAGQCHLFVIAGRDAAERYASWDYGSDESFTQQLRRYRLAVADRDGSYEIAPAHTDRILPFRIDARHERNSSSAVRRAVAARTAWRHLVPEVLHARVAAAYRSADG